MNKTQNQCTYIGKVTKGDINVKIARSWILKVTESIIVVSYILFMIDR